MKLFLTESIDSVVTPAGVDESFLLRADIAKENKSALAYFKPFFFFLLLEA